MGKPGEKLEKVAHFFAKWPCRPFWMTKNHFRSHFAISDQYATFIFLNLFSKWPPAAILEVPFGPFWMTENHFQSHFSPFQINTQLFFFLFFFPIWPPAAILEVPFGPFWMTENHFRSHFSPFQINTTFFFEFFSKWPPAAILEVRVAPKTIGFFHYVLSMAMPNMKLIGEFVTQLESHKLFEHFYTKWPPRGHFVFLIDDKNHRVLVIWDLNG